MEPSATRVLKAVWGNRNGFVFITYKRHGKWTEPAALPIREGKVNLDKLQIPADADQYWCPLVFGVARRLKENALPTNLLWADLDPVHPDHCRMKPSIAWESSPGRYQALWFLNKEIPAAEAAQLSKRIAYADGGDKGGWDVTQVLRIPGTRNHKYESKPPVKLMWAKRAAYSTEEIRKTYPPLNGEMLSSRVNLTWPDIQESAIQLSLGTLPIGLRRRLSQSTEGADRSTELQKLARDLIRWGLDSNLVLHLLQRSTWNKFSGRQDEKQQLLKQVSDALAIVQQRALVKQPKKQLSASPANVNATEWNDTDEVPIQLMEIQRWTDFMTIPTHLKWLVQDSWVDQTVGFISGRSKSYKTWIALDLALSILSGQPFLGQYSVARTGPVLLIQEEDPTAILQERLRLIAKSKGMLPSISFTGNGNFNIEYPDYPLHIVNLQGFKLTDPDKLGQIREEIAIIHPVMVIVDPFINVLGEINEHQATEMVTVLQIMKMWREEFGCNVCVVHHWNKTKTEEGDRGGAHMYGSFALHAWLESALHVEPIIDPETERIDTVTIEREFKAAPGSRALKLRFEIDTVKDFTYAIYQEGLLETSKTLQAVLDVLVAHGDWMTTGNLAEATGYSRAKISEYGGKLRKIGKVEYQPGGGRGKSSVYKAKT
jgi:AAA domain/RepB DNA-primase N-terminal domain